MKNVMIPEELFGKIIKYHLLDQEQEADDIRKGLEKKLDAMVNVRYTVNPKLHQQKKNGKSSGRSIWTEKECKRAFDGNSSY